MNTGEEKVAYKYKPGHKAEFLRNGVVVASLEVFKVYSAEEPRKYHFNYIAEDEIIGCNWKLLHEESASEVFEISQGEYGNCRYDEKDLSNAFLLFKVDTIRRIFDNLPFDKKGCGGYDGVGMMNCEVSDDGYETLKCDDECSGFAMNFNLMSVVVAAATKMAVFDLKNGCDFSPYCRKDTGELTAESFKLIGEEAASILNTWADDEYAASGNSAFKDRYGTIQPFPPSVVSQYLQCGLTEEMLKSVGGDPLKTDFDRYILNHKHNFAYGVARLLEKRAELIKSLSKANKAAEETTSSDKTSEEEVALEKPSDEEVSKWPLDKQEMFKYCSIDQFEEGQVTDLKKGDSVAAVFDKKYLLSGVVYSTAKLKKVLKKGREKGSKETEERLMYHIKWDDILAYKSDGGTGAYKERKQIFRIDNHHFQKLPTGTTGLSVRYNGSFNVHEDCTIVNYDGETDTYTVNFKVDGEVCDGIKRHWIAETTVELPFLIQNQKVNAPKKPATTHGKKRKRVSDDGPSKRSTRRRLEGSNNTDDNTVDGPTCENENDVGSCSEIEETQVFISDDDNDGDYSSGDSGNASDEEDSDSGMQKLRNEWAGIHDGKKPTVESKRHVERNRRQDYPALQTLRDDNVKSGKWKFLQARSLNKLEVETVLEAYDDYLFNLQAAGLDPKAGPLKLTKKKGGKVPGKTATDERLLFKYTQKIRLINVVTDPRHAKMYEQDLRQKSRKELDENKTGSKSDLWSTVAAEFAKETAYNTCIPCCTCHPDAFPETFNSKLIFPWDSKKLYDEWQKIINGFSKAYNKINASGNHDHSCYRDSNKSGYAFDDYKVEILYFSLMMKHLGADGESFKNACIMSVSENVRVDTLDDDEEEKEKENNPSGNNDNGSPPLKKRDYKATTTSGKKKKDSGGAVSEATSAMKDLVDVVKTMTVRRDSTADESQGSKEIRSLSENLDLNGWLKKALKQRRKFKKKYPGCVDENDDCYPEYKILCDSVRKLEETIAIRNERSLLAP